MAAGGSLLSGRSLGPWAPGSPGAPGPLRPMGPKRPMGPLRPMGPKRPWALVPPWAPWGPTLGSMGPHPGLHGAPTLGPHGNPDTYLVRKKSSIPKTQDLQEKISNFEIHKKLLGPCEVLTPTSILIFIAAFEFGLQKLI